MLQWEEVTKIITDVNNYNIERISNIDEIDKICQGICAFSNDITGSFKNGYIIIGSKENGRLTGITASEGMISQMYSLKRAGNIFPHPQIEVQKFSLPTGEIILIEVSPSEYPPVRYNGKVWIKLGNRKSIAYDAEEKKLTERRLKLSKSFDSQPSFFNSIDCIDSSIIKDKYIPLAIKRGAKINDSNYKTILESLRLYDTRYDRPTIGAILLFGKNTRENYPGAFIRYAKFEGDTKSSKLLSTQDITGSIYQQLIEII